MATPVHEIPQPIFNPNNVQTSRSSDEEGTYVGEENDGNPLILRTTNDSDRVYQPSPSRNRAQDSRLDDDLAMLQAERVVSNAQSSQKTGMGRSMSMARSRSKRSEHVDEFDVATNPIHEKTAVYKPPEHPQSRFAKAFKKVHDSSFLVRYVTYIVPVVIILLIPLLLGALLFNKASVGGVELLWFSVWLEIVWLTLWAGRIVAKMIPWPLGLVSSLFTNNSKKWRDMGKQLEVPATLFFWWLGIEISFLPTMKGHHINGNPATKPWESVVSKIIVGVFIGVTLNFIEKIIIQLIAISFHLRTYSDRIELNKFQIGSLTKLYQYSKDKIAEEDSDFEDRDTSGPGSGARTPMQYLDKAQKNVTEAFRNVGDVAGKVAGDFTGKQVAKSSHPHQVVLMLLNSTPGSQVLARRLFRTFVRQDTETVFSEDLKDAFENDEEAEAAFTMFDKDLNGDISMEELEAVCVEIGRERKSITASLKDLDSVVSKLDGILVFIIIIVTILIFVTIISASAAGVLSSAGSAVLALSWLFSATAQEFLQSVIFVFVKHPFDVGDRVTIYGNAGAALKGDDYFVKEISLLFTEFKKMEGHVVQAPNSYLNTLFILNMRRSGGLAEAVPLTVKFGTTIEQVDDLRQHLLDFVKAEKREYQANILTEIRDVVEAYSINLNVIFFYKSNWQNEGLRLQRRNKFICAMMLFMQEVGIEGPRMRNPGQTEHLPFFVQQQSVNRAIEPSDTGSHGDPGPRSGSLVRDGDHTVRHHPSILRHTPSSSHMGGRMRGESVSSMSKRVDFSLGMKNVSSGDIMGDIYDDGPRARLPNYSKSRSRDHQNRIEEEDVIREDSKLGRSSSRAGGSQSRFGLGRRSTESQTRLRTAESNTSNTSNTHRNRFFGRGKDSGDGADEDLMESGMAEIPESADNSGRLDPRSGTISPKAMRLDTNNSAGSGVSFDLPSSYTNVGKMPAGGRTEDFEMRKLGK